MKTNGGDRRVSLPARLLSLPVAAYRRWISPLKPPCCRFTPTCSAYALEALAEWGALRGSYLALRRILRCQPFGGFGDDPVPKRRRRPDGPYKTVPAGTQNSSEEKGPANESV